MTHGSCLTPSEAATGACATLLRRGDQCWVCVPGHFADDEIVEFANRTSPLTDGGWRIEADPEVLGFIPVRDPCWRFAGFVHIQLVPDRVAAGGASVTNGPEHPSVIRCAGTSVVCVPKSWSLRTTEDFANHEIPMRYGSGFSWRVKPHPCKSGGGQVCIAHECPWIDGHVHITLEPALGSASVLNCRAEPEPMPGTAEIVALYDAAFRVANPRSCDEDIDLTQLIRAVADAAPFIKRMRTTSVAAKSPAEPAEQLHRMNAAAMARDAGGAR